MITANSGIEKLGFSVRLARHVWEDHVSASTDFRKIHGHCVPKHFPAKHQLSSGSQSRTSASCTDKERHQPMILPQIQFESSGSDEWDGLGTTGKTSFERTPNIHKILVCNVPHN
jgi:hypothetical protein